MADYKHPNPARLRSMKRFPEPQSIYVDDPDKTSPIYGTYGNLRQLEGADYDIECAAWGDNEQAVSVTVDNERYNAPKVPSASAPLGVNKETAVEKRKYNQKAPRS